MENKHKATADGIAEQESVQDKARGSSFLHHV